MGPGLRVRAANGVKVPHSRGDALITPECEICFTNLVRSSFHLFGFLRYDTHCFVVKLADGLYRQQGVAYDSW